MSRMPDGRRNSDGAEGIEVHEAHFSTFDATLAQRVQRALPGANAPLGRIVP